MCFSNCPEFFRAFPSQQQLPWIFQAFSISTAFALKNSGQSPEQKVNTEKPWIFQAFWARKINSVVECYYALKSTLRILTSKSSYVLAGRFPSHKVGHGILPALGKTNICKGKKAAKTSDPGTATLLWHGSLLCITSDQGPAKIMAI